MFNPHDLSAQVSILLCPHITDPIVQTSVFVYFETTKTLPNKKHFIYIASVIFMILFFLIFRLWKPLHIVDHKQHCRNAPGYRITEHNCLNSRKNRKNGQHPGNPHDAHAAAG